MSRPIIGVTEPNPDRGGNFSYTAIRLAIWLAGGHAVRLTPDDPGRDIELSGLVLAGGTDIHPPRYGGVDHRLTDYDFGRDQMEAEWFARLDMRGVPILGICRGAQMMNVCRGGTLYADVKLVHEEASHPVTAFGKIVTRKWINVERDSRLHKMLLCNPCLVNSLHHQCVDKPGRNVRIIAKEKRGIVQAIEDADYPTFWLGVQWHPEYMPLVIRQRRIFKAFIRAARNYDLRKRSERVGS